MADGYAAAPAVPQETPVLGARDLFIARTYGHLFAAVLAFIALELIYFSSGMAARIGRTLLSVDWLIVLGGFILVSWLARGLASRTQVRGIQYLGLAGFVVAESIIFVPLLYVADFYAPGAIRSAALLTGLGFTGLTTIAFRSRRDFAVLRVLLQWVGVLALITIVGALVFGLSLGMWFSLAMIAFAGAAVLFDTSNIIHHFPEDAHVAAALELFASVALMFWYLVSIFTSRD